VADALELDRVLWMPAGAPPHKPESVVSPAAVRLEMARAAACADPRFEVSPLEIERPGPSYTVDTLRELRTRMPEAELFLIVGVDQFRALASWHRPEALAGLATIVVMDRGGESAGPEEAAPVETLAEWIVVPVRRVDVSSTKIRARVARGEDGSASVPEGVHGIIARERLYGA
jgi:nicotinate-nucleotide adenylyltransferase